MEFVKDNTISVFWSGGMDSTFMVLDFLRRGYKVQPHYINKYAKYTAGEVKSIEYLNYLIRKNFDFGKNLLPVDFFTPVLGEWETRPELVEAWKHVYIDLLGYPACYIFPKRRFTQYMLFVSLVDKFSGSMIGITGESINRPILEKYGKMKYTLEGFGYLDKADSDPSVYTVFGGYVYPLIHTSEREMLKLSRTYGFLEVIKHVKFCYNESRYGEPCGICPPCQSKFHYKMYEYFTEEGYRNAIVKNDLFNEGLLFKGNPVMDYFEKYCIIKKENPFFNDLQLAMKVNVPLIFCKDFARRLSNVKIDKNIKKQLGRWVFKETE